MASADWADQERAAASPALEDAGGVADVQGALDAACLPA